MRSENFFSVNSAASFLCVEDLKAFEGGRGLGLAEMLTIRDPLLCHTFASVSFKTVVSFFMFFLRPLFYREKGHLLGNSSEPFDGTIWLHFHLPVTIIPYYSLRSNEAFFPFTLGKGISSQLERKSWQLAHILRLQQGGQRPKSTRI